MSYEYDYEFDSDSLPRQTAKQQKESIRQEFESQLINEGLELNQIAPVGRKTFVRSYWAKKWVLHLTHFEKSHDRLKIGRSLFRQMGLLDLQIEQFKITAKVCDQELHSTKISFKKVSKEVEDDLLQLIHTQVGDMISLLKGDLSEDLKNSLSCLFPSLEDILFDCDCFDASDFCHHAAATLYGIACLFEKEPKLIFKLRGIDLEKLANNASQTIEFEKIDSPSLESTFDIDLI